MSIHKAVAVILILLSTSVMAEHDFITNIHLSSYHIGSEPGKYNEENFGIGIEHKGYIVGTFVNSINRQSIYFGKAIELCSWCGIKVGGITGYAYKVSPMVIGYARFQNIEIGLIPPSPKNLTTITFGLWF